MSGELDELRGAVEALALPVDTGVLAEGLGLLSQLTAHLSKLAGEVEADGLCELDGATSLVGWLRDHGGMAAAPAAGFARVARRLRPLPHTTQAWLDGELSTGQVQAVVARLDDECAPLFAEHEPDVVPTLVPLTVAETVTAMAAWRERADAVLDRPEPAERPDAIHLSRTLDGRFELRGSFGPDLGGVLDAALRVATPAWTADDGATSPAERRAEAVGTVCQFFLDNQQQGVGGRHRPHVNLVIELGADGTPRGGILDGGGLAEHELRRALCDCVIHRVLRGDGTVVDYGRATRSVPAPLWALLVLRDQTCREPGCDRPAAWCDAHHVVPWEDGGETNLQNLVLKCRRHHTLGHRPGWQDRLLPDGTYEVTDPLGRTRSSRPPGTIAAGVAASIAA